MKLTFDVAPKEAAAIRGFYEKWENSALVQARKRRNLDGQREPVTETLAWDAKVRCLLTTQQRSGPQSPIVRFIRSKPFPLGLAAARAQIDVEGWVHATLRAAPGIRRYNQLASQIRANFQLLEEGLWTEVMSTLRTLEQPHEKSDERRAAHVLHDLLAGIGPKQARNLLQMLGLTQHEVPLDSRVAKWLATIDFPVPVSAALLSSPHFYDFVLDGFQQVASAAGVVPCLLDAAIFVSFDSEWSKDEVVW